MERRKGKVHEVSEGELRRRLADAGDDSDRRRQERVDVQLQVDVPLASWEQVRSVYTSNISKGGMLFTLSSPASIPAAVALTLTMPDGRKVTLQSQVRHVAPREGGGAGEFEVGVQFAALDAATQRAFEDALLRLN
jgi:c-di-GMP-binding flagellar brake protein YcgR